MALSNITNTSRRQRPTSSTDDGKMTPLNFIVALYPGFQLMDLAGPLDILNIVSLPPFSQPLRLTFLASTMDPVPTKPVPPPNADYTYDLTNVLGTENVNTTFQQYLTPRYTYASYLSALESNNISEHELPDILFIPGGLGSRMHRIPLNHNGTHKRDNSTLNVADLISWIPTITPHLSTGIITVCTGSDILARTDPSLLSHRRATTNMLRFADIAARHPQVLWQKGARYALSPLSEGRSTRKTVEEGRDIEIWSSAGISAGMDVTLAFVEAYYGGRGVAREIARRLEVSKVLLTLYRGRI